MVNSIKYTAIVSALLIGTAPAVWAQGNQANNTGQQQSAEQQVEPNPEAGYLTKKFLRYSGRHNNEIGFVSDRFAKQMRGSNGSGQTSQAGGQMTQGSGGSQTSQSRGGQRTQGPGDAGYLTNVFVQYSSHHNGQNGFVSSRFAQQKKGSATSGSGGSKSMNQASSSGNSQAGGKSGGSK